LLNVRQILYDWSDFVGTDSGADKAKHAAGSGDGRRRRPAWHFVAIALAVLVLCEAGLAAYTVHAFNSYGFFEKVPIVTKASPRATLTPPPDLQPGDNSGDTSAQDDSEDVNLQVGTTPIYQQDPIDPNVVNILVLGLDTRTPGGNGRSDMNMIVSIDHSFRYSR
jgi:hypothetical protein